MRFKKTGRRGICFLMMFSLIGCAGTSSLVSVDINPTPILDDKKAAYVEEQLGEAGYYYILLNYKLMDDPAMINRLNRIGARLSKYTERPEIKYKYFVIDSQFHNAYSFPNGYIFITQALLTKLQSDDQMAAVLAHEIAHSTHKHSFKEYERVKGAHAWQKIFGKDVFSIATQIGHNQMYELEADQSSLRYLKRSGYAPKTAIEVLTRLKEMEKEDAELQKKLDEDKKNKKSEIFLTHPVTENRIVNLRNLLTQVEETEKVLYDPSQFNF